MVEELEGNIETGDDMQVLKINLVVRAAEERGK